MNEWMNEWMQTVHLMYNIILICFYSMYSKQLHFHSCQIWNLTWQRTKPTTPHLSLPSSLTWIKHLNCLELSTELMSLGYKTREKIAGCQKAAQIVHLRASQRAWCISARRCRIFYGQTSPNKKPWMQGGFVCACVCVCVCVCACVCVKAEVKSFREKLFVYFASGQEPPLSCPKV